MKMKTIESLSEEDRTYVYDRLFDMMEKYEREVREFLIDALDADIDNDEELLLETIMELRHECAI